MFMSNTNCRFNKYGFGSNHLCIYLEFDGACIDDQILSMMFRTESGWTCSVCGKQSNRKTDITRHVEGLHVVNHPGYNCDICGQSAKTKYALGQHKRLKHNLT